MNISDKHNKPIGSNDSKCVVHKSVDACEVLEYYDGLKDETSLIENKLICKKCTKSYINEYTNSLNTGQVSSSLQHYIDIAYGVELWNTYYQADTCKHVKDPDTLKKSLSIVVNDYEESLKQRKYLPTFETENDALEVLKSQLYPIEDHREEEGSTKYVIELPYGRVSTTEIESAAMNRLSTRPVITNIEKQFFIILKDSPT